jgi:hypothetical protein
MAIVKDPVELVKLWQRMDAGGNDRCTLFEIETLMAGKKYTLLNNKPALIRAYKQSCLGDDGDGDAFVEPPEFPSLLINLFYFNKLYQCFDAVDADHDRRMDEAEFIAGLKSLGLRLNEADAKAEFAAMDSNNGGVVQFDEFCIWYTKKVMPEREIIDCEARFVKVQKESRR